MPDHHSVNQPLTASGLAADMYRLGNPADSRTMTMSGSMRFISGILGGACLFRTAVRPLSVSGILSSVLGFALLYNALNGSNWRESGCTYKREVTARYKHWKNRMSQTDIICTVGPYKYRAGIRA